MPIDPRTQFTFRFDERGRMRLENTEKSLEFLDALDEREELHIVLGAEGTTPPNLTQDCGELKPPQPNKVIGCQNTLCPMEIKLKLSKLIQTERIRVVDDRIREAGGGLGGSGGGG